MSKQKEKVQTEILKFSSEKKDIKIEDLDFDVSTELFEMCQNVGAYIHFEDESLEDYISWINEIEKNEVFEYEIVATLHLQLRPVAKVKKQIQLTREEYTDFQ